MNIIFDNIIYSKERQGGISNYWYHITRQYEQDAGVCFYEEKNAGENIFRRQMNIQNVIRHDRRNLVLARLGPVVNHGSMDSLLYHSSFYRRLVSKSQVFEITTIHDFLHNKYSGGLKKMLHNSLKYAAIKRSKGIICVSDNTLKDLRRYCPPKSGQKVTRIYNGISNDYRPVSNHDATHNDDFTKFYSGIGKYILFVGARSRYKNFDFVQKVAGELPSYKLVIVGNPLSVKEKSAFSTKMLEKTVVATGISNTQLNYLYNHAHALLYPSSYEGFGIPVAEAMKAGCPVVALSNSSIPEIAGGAARLFDTMDIYQFVQEITHLENNDYRAGIIEKGLKNANRFSWEKCADETTAFYKYVYS